MWNFSLFPELKNLTCHTDHKIYQQNFAASDLEIILEFPKHTKQKQNILNR